MDMPANEELSPESEELATTRPGHNDRPGEAGSQVPDDDTLSATAAAGAEPEAGTEPASRPASEPAEAAPAPSSEPPQAAAAAPAPALDWLTSARERARQLGLDTALEKPPRPARGASPVLWVISVLSLLIATASLSYNVLLTRQLLERRDRVLSVMDRSVSALDSFSSKGLDFNFPVSQTIDWEGDIPFKQDMEFPIQTTIHFATTVRVPVDLGALGTIWVNVPINTDVPVDMKVPVHVDQSFHIKLKVPIEMNVPVHVAPDQEPIKGMLEQARSLVQEIRAIMQ